MVYLTIIFRALADTDSDGKMNIDEFSMACKLINLKLRGFEVPKTLPPTMIASLKAVGGTPILTPTAGMSPAASVTGLSSIIPPPRPGPPAQLLQQQSKIPPIVPQPPIVPKVPEQAALISGIGIIPQQPVPQILPPPVQQPIIPAAVPIIPIAHPAIIPQSVAPISAPPPIVPMQPIMTQPQIAPLIQPVIAQQQPLDSALLIDSLVNVNSVAPIPAPISNENLLINQAVVAPLPAPPTPPSGTQSRSMSISEKAPSIESPGSATGSGVEWAIKGQAKLKYTQLFNTTDRTRSGFLTGAQARGLLMQSKLPQAILAKIWALSDMDSDGRLGCEEFVLAMYLCDLALQGEQIPAKLPPELIPPSFRKVASRHGSVSSATPSRHGSVSSQGAAAPSLADIDLTHYSQTSFEDKRKENFDKGQAELDRRRRVLEEASRKEIEERQRKEREEIEKKEKARLEAERRQQEELERQLQIQRELEQEREEKRKRELEQKEAARKEMEKQRQIGKFI